MFRIRLFKHAGRTWLEARLSKHLRLQIEATAQAVKHLCNNGFPLTTLQDELDDLFRTLVREDGRLCVQAEQDVVTGEIQPELFTDEVPLEETPGAA